MADESLRKKTIKGTAWSFIDNVSSNLITFVVLMVLARILNPEDYGLIAIVTVFISIFSSIVDSGFSNALIRKKDASEIDYNTAFLVNLGISVVLFVVLFLGAPGIAAFFERPALTDLTRVMSVIVLINAFALIQRTRLVKALNFKTQTKISLIASSVSGAVGITMALTGCGVWSLVAQQVSRQLLNSVFLWVFNRWIPSMQFSGKSFRELFSFGWKLMVSGIINTIWNEIYQVVIGKFYSPSTLGQYSRASQFTFIFITNITSVVQRVSYPALSAIQDDTQRLKCWYRKVIKLTMYGTFICMMGLAAIAEPLVVTMIGEKWLPCVPFLQILCFSTVLYPLSAINLNMLQVKGRSDLFLILEIVKKVVAAGPVLLGIFVDIYWMLGASVVTGVIYYFLNSYYSGREIGYSSMAQLKDLAPSFALALFMGGCVYALSLIQGVPPVVMLALQLLLGAGMVVGLSKLFKFEEYSEIKSIVISFIKKDNGQK